MTHQFQLNTSNLTGLDDSKLVGVPVALAGDAVIADQIAVIPVEVKRKRGRPPRSQAKAPPVKKQKDDEDVCFICFDGGSLVLCDRRACPKAYHPACIKRDEEFFRSNAKWNCGWHICSVCQKAAHYMCYTCPFSLCKGCTRDSSYLCVRGNKGFCTTCMKVIMMIENKEQSDKEVAQVDFDDSRNWEYLFKIYWISLKDELALTSKEIAEAKNPWKEISLTSSRKQPSNVNGGTNNITSAVINMSSGHVKGNDSLGQNSSESIKLLNTASLNTGQQCNDGTSSEGRMDWASKKLLDFVAFMKNGDTSLLSPFDVQVLVLDYIKRNNLHDPCERSHVVCDARLETLFGKSRVGHIEMPQLLDFHFLVKEQPAKDDFVRGRVDDVNAVPVSSDQINSNLMINDEKHNTRVKGVQCTLEANLNEYAAINVSNINLIYMRRSLMENLIQVKEKFHEMVVGSLVRIRISGDEHKQDMYRLVQVVGTTKVPVPYKIGNTTSDITLEILNLDKKEFTSIDAISNQDLSEDDCRRLRQSIKCGLVKRFTVGEIQKKAIQLQVVRLNDSLEAEMLRLNHLRDRASKNGLENELREFVEKIQLLKAPEERQRRLSQVPEVTSDPNMDPDYESEEDAGEHGHHVKSCNPEYNREGSEPVPLRKRGDISGDNSDRRCNSLSPPCEGSPNLCATSYPDKEESAAKALQRLSEGKFACRSNSLEIRGCNRQAVATSTNFSEASSAPLSDGNTLFTSNAETKLWHYRDPNGSIQGPFSIVELQMWSTTGYFPLDMRIWANDKQDDSVLLTDALKGYFHKVLPGLNDISSHLREVESNKLCNSSSVWSGNTDATDDRRQTEGNWHGNIAEVNAKSKSDVVGSDRLGTQSSAWTAPIVSYNKDITAGTASQNQDSFKGNSFCYEPLQVHSQLSSSMFPARDYATHPHELNSKVKICNSNSDPGISLSHGTTVCNNTGDVLGNHCSSQGFVGQSSEKKLGHSPVSFLPNNLDLNSVFCPTKSTDSPDQSGEIIENKESVSSSVNVHDPYIRDHPNFTLMINNNDQKGLSVEKKQSVSSNISVQDSAPSWSSTSSIMLGRSQALDMTDKWGGYSAPMKHSVEWDSNLNPVSSSLHDYVGTATPRSCEPTQFTLLNPASNFSSWHTTGSEPIEFSTLAEESVSDLLAEVDAMESQCGMASPTSMMNYGDDLINLNLEIA